MKTEEKVGELLKAKNFSLSTAESCTGGGIAAFDNFRFGELGVF